MSICIVNIVLNCLPDYRITSTNSSYFRHEQNNFNMAVSGELRTKAVVLFKEQVNHPNRKTMAGSFCLHGWKAWSFAVLKRVKIFVTKGRLLNISKRNSRRATIVHKEKKLWPLRKGIVFCEPSTQRWQCLVLLPGRESGNWLDTEVLCKLT